MSLLHLDYQRSMKPFPAAGVILLLLSVAALFLTGDYYRLLLAKMAEAEAWQNKAELAASRRIIGERRDTREVMQEVKHANEVLQQLSLPWRNLFLALESSSGADVTLLGMEPDIEKRIVRVSCEAKDVAAMLDYIRRLEKARGFGKVYLQSHQIQEQDPGKPVRFSLSAAWETVS